MTAHFSSELLGFRFGFFFLLFFFFFYTAFRYLISIWQLNITLANAKASQLDKQNFFIFFGQFYHVQLK